MKKWPKWNQQNLTLADFISPSISPIISKGAQVSYHILRRVTEGFENRLNKFYWSILYIFSFYSIKAGTILSHGVDEDISSTDIFSDSKLYL